VGKHLKADYYPQVLVYQDFQIVDDELAEILCGSHADHMFSN
jgi:hypothetical protein